MWLAGAAADAGVSTNEVIIAVSGLLVAVVTAAAGVIVALVNARNKTSVTAPAPPGADDHDDWIFARERIAVLDQRADDADVQREIADRRLDQIERHLDLDKPHWKHYGGDHRRR